MGGMIKGMQRRANGGVGILTSENGEENDT